ncbi:hypothetical protein [Nostoc sp.]|uniref:hypothetical protein n=1 Tax=Nostoc sp. TaxID=1180 RepID=UPI002FF6302E
MKSAKSVPPIFCLATKSKVIEFKFAPKQAISLYHFFVRLRQILLTSFFVFFARQLLQVGEPAQRTALSLRFVFLSCTYGLAHLHTELVLVFEG